MTDIGHPQGMKIPPAPLFQRGVLKSPFNKGGFRGIWFFTVKPAATENSLSATQYKNFSFSL
jgi:hypothetical protein